MATPGEKQLTPDVVIADVMDDVKKPEVKIEGEEVEVVVEDDTPPEDQGRRRREPDVKPYDPTDDEIAKLDESVKTRIGKLRFEFHEERRLKEEAGRREQAAIQYAKKVMAENNRLQQTLSQGEKTLVEQAQARAKAEMTSARRALQEATAAGDAEKIADATQQMAQHAAELEQYKAYTPQYDQPAPPEKAQQEFDRQIEQPRAHPKAVAWHQRNQWFNKDEVLTLFARGLDDVLIKSGANPGSDEYYSFIDSKVREKFPDRFDGGGHYLEDGEPQERVENKSGTNRPVARQAKTVVAPANRSSPGNGKPRQVTLTKSQADVARRLGIPVEAYAAQLLKEQANG